MCSSRKKSILPSQMGVSCGVWGVGFSKTKECKEMIKRNWNFQRGGGGVLEKSLLCRRYGYFLELQSPTQQNSLVICLTQRVESLHHFVSDTWEWEDAKGNWTEYSKPIVYLLETAVLFGLTSIKFKEDKKELMVDLTKKVQTTKAGRAAKTVHRIKASDAGRLIVIFSFFGMFSRISSVDP